MHDVRIVNQAHGCQIRSPPVARWCLSHLAKLQLISHDAFSLDDPLLFYMLWFGQKTSLEESSGSYLWNFE
jgi:hypothetical protein